MHALTSGLSQWVKVSSIVITQMTKLNMYLIVFKVRRMANIRNRSTPIKRKQICDWQINSMSQYMGLWYLSHRRAMNAHVRRLTRAIAARMSEVVKAQTKI